MTDPLGQLTSRLRVGISACLLGQSVRYDGGHKREPAVADTLARIVDFAPVCPEVEAGMGVPREPIELTRIGDEVRLLGVTSAADHSAAMSALVRRRLADLTATSVAQPGVSSVAQPGAAPTDMRPISGYIFKSGSPSCGLDVPVFARHEDRRQPTEERGRGMFAAALLDRLPDLPVVEEETVRAPAALAHFVDRMRACARLQVLFSSSLSARALVDFHSREKLLLMANDHAAYRELGPMVARAGIECRQPESRERLGLAYRQRFTRALLKAASVGRHVNVLQHMAGYFREYLSATERAELARAIETYRAGQQPLTHPLDRIREYARAFDVQYLLIQSYLDSHGSELITTRS